MKSAKFILLLTASCLIFGWFAPTILFADDIVVEQNPTDDSHFSSIQRAIDHVQELLSANTGTTTTYSILVEPGTYTEAITLKPGISSLRGRETARTILNGEGSAFIVTANNITSQISLQNFTFTYAKAGILVSGSSSINITNNVFSVGSDGTAVQIQVSPATTVVNNTFYQNGTAVSRDSESNQIVNNIFSNNTNYNISQSPALQNPQSNITFNDFNPAPPETVPIIGSNSINSSEVDPDPRFVDITGTPMDAHLQSGSPCIGTGDPTRGAPNDMGAYGGTNADTIPFQIRKPLAVATSTDAITVSWAPNKSYLVTNSTGSSSGSYNVYYNFGVSGAPYQNHVSLISSVTSTVISGLTFTSSTPSAPVLNISMSSPLDKAIKLNWPSSPGATGYTVHWGTASPDEHTIDVGNTTSTILSGLTNGQHYQLAVSAYTSATYYFSVTALDNTANEHTPGIAHESAYSPEAAVPVGERSESVNSNVLDVFPEAIVPYPALSDARRGCFIATAAYGHYSDPEVRALRAFRDQYLLTNRAGAAFVRWYYTHGPAGAAYLENHPEYKPVVRAALMPAVGLALVMTQTSWISKTVAVCFLAIMILLTRSFLPKMKASGTGGTH